jgi:hypothetical protein
MGNDMTSTKIDSLENESSLQDMPKKYPTEPTDRCFEMLVSTSFATMKVKKDFHTWLRMESVRRGIFLYELVEELASRSLAGKKPWDGADP